MILVTGATGNVGGEVVRQLVAAGAKVRAFVRRAEGATLPPGVEVAEGDLAQPETFPAAMKGVEKIYLLVPGTPALPKLEGAVLEAARAAGVKHVVKHSVMGARYEPSIMLGSWHRASESLLEASGLAWTFVRPGTFMSNALQWVKPIRAQGAVFMPLGEGRVAVVDPRDIAAVAAKALTEPGHEGKAYDVTGPEALSMAEQVKIIGDAIGRPIRYVDIPEAKARETMLALGMPVPVADGLIELYARIRAGQAANVSDAVERVTGKPARRFDAWVREHSSAFRS